MTHILLLPIYLFTLHLQVQAYWIYLVNFLTIVTNGQITLASDSLLLLENCASSELPTSPVGSAEPSKLWILYTTLKYHIQQLLTVMLSNFWYRSFWWLFWKISSLIQFVHTACVFPTEKHKTVESIVVYSAIWHLLVESSTTTAKLKCLSDYSPYTVVGSSQDTQ